MFFSLCMPRLDSLEYVQCSTEGESTRSPMLQGAEARADGPLNFSDVVRSCCMHERSIIA